MSATNTAAISRNEHAHTGSGSVKLVISMTQQQQQNASVLLRGELPRQAYYSVWYFVPVSVSAIGDFWVIMKFRRRDAMGVEHELYDVNLRILGDAYTLRLYNWDTGMNDLGLEQMRPTVPRGEWFLIEADYGNDESNSHFKLWLNDTLVVDVPKRTLEITNWVWWEVANIGNKLTLADPASTTVTLFADDAAISSIRVGTSGQLPNRPGAAPPLRTNIDARVDGE